MEFSRLDNYTAIINFRTKMWNVVKFQSADGGIEREIYNHLQQRLYLR